jgi:hypothetical protein
VWDLTARDRLDTWRQLRARYATMEFSQALLEDTKIWSYAPYVNHYLDYQCPQDWPDPWALLAENYYCDLAKTLGMLYTLYLTPHRQDHDWAIKIMSQPRDNSIYHLVYIDQGKYVLNFVFSEVVNISQLDADLIELRHYTDQDLNLERFI